MVNFSELIKAGSKIGSKALVKLGFKKGTAEIAKESISEFGKTFKNTAKISTKESIMKASHSHGMLSDAAMQANRYKNKEAFGSWLAKFHGEPPRVKSGFLHGGEDSIHEGKSALIHATKSTGEPFKNSVKEAIKTIKKQPLNWDEVIAKSKKGYRTAGKIMDDGAKRIKPVAGWSLHIMEKHPILSFLAASGAYHKVSGDTLPNLILSWFGTENKDGKNTAVEQGALNTLGNILIPQQKDQYGNTIDNGLGGNLVDFILGKGTYNSAKQGFGTVAGAVGGVYNGAKDAVSGVAGAVNDAYNAGKTYLGNGMVKDGSSVPYDPTVNPYQAQTGASQSGGLASSAMNLVSNATNQISGGNVNKMDLGSLALASYLMFGRFGWLGKAASLALGGNTLKNINQHGVQRTQQLQQNATLAQTATPSPSLQVSIPEEETNVIHRSR